MDPVLTSDFPFYGKPRYSATGRFVPFTVQPPPEEAGQTVRDKCSRRKETSDPRERIEAYVERRRLY